MACKLINLFSAIPLSNANMTFDFSAATAPLRLRKIKLDAGLFLFKKTANDSVNLRVINLNFSLGTDPVYTPMQ